MIRSSSEGEFSTKPLFINCLIKVVTVPSHFRKDKVSPSTSHKVSKAITSRIELSSSQVVVQIIVNIVSIRPLVLKLNIIAAVQFPSHVTAF